MDDEFLTRFRREPRPEFANELYGRINQPMQTETKPSLRRSLVRWSPLMAVMSMFLAALLIFSFPAARAAAQDFLNLFRVKKFTAVTVDPTRLQQLEQSGLDFETLLGKDVKVVKKAAEPRSVASPAEAGRIAGFRVRVPSELPVAGALSSTMVQGEAEALITADTEKLESVLQLLNITDVKIPEKLNGATVRVKKPSAVMLRYAFGGRNVTIIQSHSPEVTLPEGVDLKDLGQIALRAAGLSKDEAQRFSQSVDWNSTLLVPVPANAGSFREVEVHGAKGLMITMDGTGNSFTPRAAGRQSSVVLWSEGDMVYAVQGDIMAVDLLALANALQ